MVNHSIKYNATSHATQKRNPSSLFHSRFVHLKSLNRLIKRVTGKYIQSKKNIIFGDFGCGELPYFDSLNQSCKEYLAIDLPENAKATHHVDIDTNRSDINDNYCDIVWSIQVLEHVGNYSKYLTEAHRILKKNGLIIASTHGQWKYHPDPIDYWRWTSQGLKETFESNGFEIIEFRGSMSFLSTSIQLFQDACLLSFPLAKYWGKPFCLFIQITMCMTEWYSRKSKTLNDHRNLDSDVYFVIAKKK